MHAVEIETRWSKKDEQTMDGAFSHQESDETHGNGSFFFIFFLSEDLLPLEQPVRACFCSVQNRIAT